MFIEILRLNAWQFSLKGEIEQLENFTSLEGTVQVSRCIWFCNSVRDIILLLNSYSGRRCLLKGLGLGEIGAKVIAMCEHLKVTLKVLM